MTQVDSYAVQLTGNIPQDKISLERLHGRLLFTQMTRQQVTSRLLKCLIVLLQLIILKL